MKKTSQLAWLMIFLTVLSSGTTVPDSQTGHSIVQAMFEKTSEIKTVTYELTKQERIDGKLIKQRSFTKIVSEPFQVYFKHLYPTEGIEVLYPKGENNDKALINPDGFPWVNLRLNPMGGTMRNDQHHTLFESGFDHVASILKFLCEKYRSTIDELIVYNGMVEYNGKTCYSVSMDNPHFKYIDYTIQENESILDIAARFKLSEHMILEKNSSVNDYDDIVAGQVIQIPTDYSPKMLLYLDQESFIPLRMDVYDDLGLYEKYEYSEVSINPSFSEGEFSADFPGYGF